MADGRNLVILIGNLGADPELRGQGGDGSILKLRVATTESYFDKRSNERKERTDWHNVTLFGKRAEALARLLSKGSRVYTEGRLETRSYEKDGQKHYATDVVAMNLILLDGRSESGDRRDERPAQRPAPAPSYGTSNSASGGGSRWAGGDARAPAPRQESAPDPDPGYDDDIPF